MNSRFNWSDYCPLEMDLSDLANTPSDSSDINAFAINSSWGVETPEDLIDIALSNNLSVFQIIVLFVKFNFEGSVIIGKEFLSDEFSDSGTSQMNEVLFKSRKFVPAFYENLTQFAEGLNKDWNLIKARNRNLDDIDFESVIHFVLSNLLWRVPVSSLSGFDINIFKSPGTKKSEYYKQRFELVSLLLSLYPDLAVIYLINDKYIQQFRSYLIAKESKERKIAQLNIKLGMALDPNILNVEELERKYTEFIIENESKKPFYSRRLQSMKDHGAAGDWFHEGEERIRKIFRTIAKNCRESHDKGFDETVFPEINDFFFTATNIHNRDALDSTDLLIQEIELLELLSKLIKFRKLNNLTVSFIDYTGKGDNSINQVERMFIHREGQDLKNKISQAESLLRPQFKLKQITDQDLCAFHIKKLEADSQEMDRQIDALLAEIDLVMRNKSTQIEKS